MKCDFTKEYFSASNCYVKDFNDTTKVVGGLAKLTKRIDELKVGTKINV